MKLTRRSFVKLAVGAIGGIHLTPLPWYLMDDAAIWSQNWWFRQVPEKGRLSFSNTVCTLCPGGCGIEAALVGYKRVMGVTGNREHPVNLGGVCPVGASGPQFTYGLSRVKSPLKQTGKRGDASSFKEISWDEAIGEVGGKLATLRTKGKNNLIAGIDGSFGQLSSEFLLRFFQAYGSPNFFSVPSSAQAEELASYAMTGVRAGFSYDLANSRYILSLGCGLFEGWGSPGWVHQVFSRKNGENTLVQVDSRMSPTAARADRWVAVKPGTEALFALGLCNVIISEGLYDRGFVNLSRGFDEFASYVKEEYPVDFVADLCGVREGEIASVAKEFAKMRPAVALWGRGKGSMPDSLLTAMAAMALNALVGSLGSRGGLMLTPEPPLKDWPDPVFDNAAEAGLRTCRLDLPRSQAGSKKPENYLDFLVGLRDAGPSGLGVLIVNSANPAYGPVAPDIFKKALANVETVVSITSYMDETATLSDYILPADGFLETLDGLATPRGMPFPVFNLATPVLTRQYDTKPVGDIIISLASAVGGTVDESFPWDDWEEALKVRVAGIAEAGRGAVADEETAIAVAEGREVKVSVNFDDADDLWDKLSGSAWFDPGFHPLIDFKKPPGRFSFVAGDLAMIGLDKKAIPKHFQAALTGDEKKFPLLLVPVELMLMPGSSLGAAPYLMKMLRDDQLKKNTVLVDVNPATAGKLGLKQGKKAWLETPRGSIMVKVNITEGARPGVVYLPVGLGHSAYDKFVKGKGTNAFELMEYLKDKDTGEVSWWGTRARLQRI